MRQGWARMALGTVLLKTETVNPDNFPNKEFTYIDVSSVDNQKFSIKNPTILLGKDAPSRARKLIKTHDIIFATVRPTLRRIAIVPEVYHGQVCSTGYFVLRSNHLIFNKLLFYYLLTPEFNTRMEKLQRGASYPAVTDSDVKEQIIEFPQSLPEQHRIVAILDEVFDSISSAKDIAERNLRNTRELFESYLQNIFDNPIKKWDKKKLGTVCEISMGQSPDGTTYNNIEIGMPLINGPVEFGPDPFSETIKSKFTTQPTKTCRKGDLILCVRGSTTGRINIAGFDACIGRGVASIRYERCQPWINYFVLASRLKIYSMGTGSTFPNVSSQLISSLIVPMPVLSEQLRIIANLDTISAEVKKLESIYQQKLSDLEELKKSVLQKAFNGELVID